MLRDWRRFNREAQALIGMNGTAPSLGQWLEQRGFSRHFIERLIDRYMERVELPPKFVIPGGAPISAQLDLGRAILRRAERRAVALDGGEGIVADELLRFLNRASDAAYAMARFADVDDPELFAGREREHPKT